MVFITTSKPLVVRQSYPEKSVAWQHLEKVAAAMIEDYRCRICNAAVQPHWIAEAYRDAIIAADTGLVQRNLLHADLLECLLYRVFAGKGRFLDVAGGYGLLTRLLRDRGFDCRTTDPYCQNLLARTFEPEEGFRADALFAFEVLEHLEQPLSYLRELMGRYQCRTVILSTVTFEGPPPPPAWWYYAFDEGQHITFYQLRTLEYLASELGLHLMPLTPMVFLLTDRSLSVADLQCVKSGMVTTIYRIWVKRQMAGRSRTMADHLSVKRGGATRSA